MTNIDPSTLIVVGKIGSTYGVKGWLKIHSYTEYGPDITNYQPWYISNQSGGWDTFKIEDSNAQDHQILAKFSGIDTPEQAKVYAGRTIAITRSQLPQLPTNEFYWSDLEGLEVIDTNGQSLGIVQYVMATGANDVLVVKGTKEHAIPYLKDTVIKKVDLTKKQIIVDWEII